MNNLFKTFLLLAALLLASTAHARVLAGLMDRNGNPVHSGDEFTLHVSATVTTDPYGYRYSYDLTNDVLSNQPIWKLFIITNDSYSVIKGSSNSPWGKGAEPNPLAQAELWAKAIRWHSDPDLINPPPLAPGQTLAGYAFLSPYPPGIIKMYAEGDTNYPWYDSAPSNPDAYDLISPYGPGKVMSIIGPVKPVTPNVTDNYSVVGCAGGICDVQLDITGPQDPYGTAYTYTWSGAFGTATGSKPLVQLAAGTYQVSVAVSDPYATLVTATMPITVVDPNPPAGGGNAGGGNAAGGNTGGNNYSPYNDDNNAYNDRSDDEDESDDHEESEDSESN